ncbi:MAG: cytochrome c biogenesis protein ResB [Pyrinomonadaceae bacterium]
MSAIEEKKIILPSASSVAATSSTTTRKTAKPEAANDASFLTKFLALLSSVRFGIVLLVSLVIGSMIGMLIMQQNVEGFEKYFFELSPAQRLLFGSLGFFDIYHSWYFNVLLLILSLNIILASIDRFPKAWTFISRPKLDASAHWLRGQQAHATLELNESNRSAVVEKINAAARLVGFKTQVTEKNGRTFVFMQRGTWNRLGAYAVHVALLTIFTGGFMTAQFGVTGQMPLKPGMTANSMVEYNFRLDQNSGPQIEPHNIVLPFQVTCTDIQQKLIKKDGPITADNTIDWLTPIKINDGKGVQDALVHLNHPIDYRGYRLFQASFTQMGRARNITLSLTPETGGNAQMVTIPRDGAAMLTDGTKIQFTDFLPDFTMSGGQPTTASDEYVNPAAVLNMTKPNGEVVRAFAFSKVPDNAPIGRAVGGYKVRLADFEKVADKHILSIQHDPGSPVVYVGFTLLALTLSSVFFFSHQRVWALVEEKSERNFEVTFGGNTNRNKLGFEDRFKKFVNAIKGETMIAAKE